jgi:peptidoglycan DL-endopeptidase LytE
VLRGTTDSTVMRRSTRVAMATALAAATFSFSVTPAEASPPSTYVVVSGDSLFGISKKLGVRFADLLSANSMTATSVILPGQQLVVPGATPAPTAAGGSYTVKTGDSLGRIASKHGVSLAALLSVNGMTVKSLILPGQTITLPAGASTAQPTDTPSQSAGVAKVIEFALAQQGKPYAFATSGPDTYDCSGLTRRAYLQIGVNLIHQSAAQALQGRAVAYTSEPILPGDLVFMATRGNDVISHVGIALSQTTWIQARRPGEVVRVGPMPSLNSIVAVRRFV